MNPESVRKILGMLQNLRGRSQPCPTRCGPAWCRKGIDAARVFTIPNGVDANLFHGPGSWAQSARGLGFGRDEEDCCVCRPFIGREVG